MTSSAASGSSRLASAGSVTVGMVSKVTSAGQPGPPIHNGIVAPR